MAGPAAIISIMIGTAIRGQARGIVAHLISWWSLAGPRAAGLGWSPRPLLPPSVGGLSPGDCSRGAPVIRG